MSVGFVIGGVCGVAGLLLAIAGIVLLTRRNPWVRVPARVLDVRRGSVLTHNTYFVEYPGPHGESLRAWATFTASTGAELFGFRGFVWVNSDKPLQVRLNGISWTAQLGSGLVAVGVALVLIGIGVAVIPTTLGVP